MNKILKKTWLFLHVYQKGSMFSMLSKKIHSPPTLILKIKSDGNLINTFGVDCERGVDFTSAHVVQFTLSVDITLQKKRSFKAFI